MIAPRRLTVWAPLPPGAYLGRRARGPSYPLAEPGCRLYGWARQALLAGVRALGLGPGDEVLVPAYHHGSEVEALRATGATSRFYDATPSLAPDPAELDGLLGPRVRALYLIHYLGFPQDASRWRSWCDTHGLLLIEDAAQAWLSRLPAGPAGSFGDLAIFCLYKTVGLPEGAASIGRAALPDPGVDSRVGVAALARRHAAWAAQRSRLVATVAARLTPPEESYDLQRDVELRPHGDKPWRSVTALAARFDGESVAAARRSNYSKLLAALGEEVPAPFGELPPGVSPLAFPVTTHEKDALLQELEEEGVKALNLWSEPHPSLPVDRFPAAAERRATTVCVPSHQELRARDVDHIAQAVLSAARRSRTPAGDPPRRAR